jgi:hypothetical protein
MMLSSVKNRGPRYHGLARRDKATTVLPHKCRILMLISGLTAHCRCDGCALDRNGTRVYPEN